MAKPAGRRGRPPHPDVLTPAEWGVLNLLRHGLNNRRIARHRGTSLDAVKYHVANIVAKLAARDRAALRHWQGRPKQAPADTRKVEEMAEFKLGAIGQVGITVADIERAVSFYGDILGLPLLGNYGSLALFNCGGTRLFLSLPEGTEPGRSSIVYFRIEDIDAGYAELRRRGVEFEGAPHMIHRHDSGVEEWMTFFRDPDGNMLALMSQVAPSA